MRKKSFLIFYVFIPFLLQAQDVEEPLITTAFEFPAHPIHRNSTWETPITSCQEAIYAVFLDPDLKITVVKKAENEAVQKVIVSDFSALNNLHHTFSIGVDGAGYIHIIGNQHNLPSNEQTGDPHAGNKWRYWVSTQPEAIGSWEFIEDNSARSIPDDVVQQASYAKFFRAANGTLFVTFRANAGLVGTGGSGPGKYGCFLAKYDHSTTTWELVGDKTGESRTMWAYENSGVAGSVYQPIQPDMYMAPSGRIHLATTINHDNSVRPNGTYTSDGWRSGTAILYGYSDDDGNTWKKADGSELSLPATVANGEVAAFISPGEIHNTMRVGALPNGNPFILYAASSQRYWTFWNGTAWENPIQMNASYDNMTVDEEGVITYHKNGLFVRARDKGNNTQAHSLESNIHSVSKFDRDFTQVFKTRILAYSAEDPMTVRGLTLNFGPESTPTALLPATSLGSFKVSQNPVANGKIAIEFEQRQATVFYELIDILGKVTKKGNATQVQRMEVAVSGLPKGTYVLRVRLQNGQWKSTNLIKTN